MKANSRAAQILKGIGIGGAVALAAANPYFGLNLIRGIKRYNDRVAWRKFHHSLRYLDRRGYVKILVDDGDKVSAKITRAGETILKKVNIDQLEIKAPKHWDGKWRLVIFDVPIAKNRSRSALTEKLKNLGFIMVQKSVWAYPYECRDEISILRKFYEVEKFVTYLKVSEVEDELDWRGRFNLKTQ